MRVASEGPWIRLGEHPLGLPNVPERAAELKSHLMRKFWLLEEKKEGDKGTGKDALKIRSRLQNVKG